MDIKLRLNANFPSLASALQMASTEKRREAAMVAVEMVVALTSLQGDEIQQALDTLHRREPPPQNLREKLEALAARLDQSYFDATENGKAGSLSLFSSARAAAAAAYALSTNDELLHESIYEAAAAVEDPAELVKIMEQILR